MHQFGDVYSLSKTKDKRRDIHSEQKFENIEAMLTDRARAVAGSHFADVRWIYERKYMNLDI